MAGSRKPGPQCSYNDPVLIDDGTMYRSPSPPPGPLGTVPLLIAHRDQRRSVAAMTHEQRMEEAIQWAHEKGYISTEVLNQLPSVQQFVISIVVVGGVLVGLGMAAGALASTGVGAILEAIAAGIVVALAAIGVITSAAQIISGIKTLIEFYEATRVAQTHADLEAAGRDFATGLAEVGVGTVMMILSVMGARQGLKMAKGVPGNRVVAKTVSEESGPVARPPARAPQPSEPPARVPGGGLEAHENAGGHLLERHVGKTPEDLSARLASDKDIDAASSFTDKATAEKAVAETIETNQAKIDSWLASGAKRPLAISQTMDEPVGISMPRGAPAASPTSSVRVILVRDASFPDGYRILTGFPKL